MNAPANIQAGVPEVYSAISNVMAQMSKEGIGKDRKNSQQGYNFRGIDDVYNTLCGVLAATGWLSCHMCRICSATNVKRKAAALSITRS